jgi:hypothetical protein
LLFAALSFGAAEPGAATHVAIVDVSPSFPPGPYSALAVDPANPSRVAVGTVTGQVAWSEDAGRSARDAQVLSARRYDAMALRGNVARAHLARPMNTGRAVRLFINSMQMGHPFPRWAFWMALGEPHTQIHALALPATEVANWLVASPAGILVSSGHGHGWTRVLGGPGPMPREPDLIGLSVAIDPADPSHALAGTTHGVMVSRNGGHTFSPHPRLRDEFVTDFWWSPEDPSMVLAVTPGAVLQSADGGASFQVALTASGEIRAVALAGPAVYVATSEGLYVARPGQADLERQLADSSIIGVARLADDQVLVATDQVLYSLGSAHESRALALMRTTEQEPFLALRGAGGVAFAITPHNVLRIGPPEPRTAHPDGAAPTMLLSLAELEQAVIRHTGLGEPDETRLHDRWYGKLMPKIVADVSGTHGEVNETRWDGLFPIRYAKIEHRQHADAEFRIMAMWDLASVVFGDANSVNPELLISRSLRENRKWILDGIRWRYREAALLAHRLRHPPADARTRLLWHMRLDEHASYLETMSGRAVVAHSLPEAVP